MDCIILAGGMGTRLKKTVPNLPKPLAPIGKIPFLEILLKQVEKAEIIERVIFSLGYKSEEIVRFVNKRKNRFSSYFLKEKKPLGTGGAIQQCAPYTNSSHFFVMNGDSYLELDWEKFLLTHETNKALVTVACTRISDSSRFGTVKIAKNSQIYDFQEKTGETKPGIINGGVYCFKRAPLPYFSLGENFSLEKDLFPKLTSDKIFGYLSSGLFIDIGTKESYNQAQRTLQFLVST